MSAASWETSEQPRGPVSVSQVLTIAWREGKRKSYQQSAVSFQPFLATERINFF
jgi:hypothetical protein